MKPIYKIALLDVAYLLTYILGSCTGIIHPACYAYVGAILPLLTAFIYLLTCASIQGFGAATVLNGFVFVILLIAGEADTTLAIGFAILTALAEIIRYFCKYDTLKGVRWSFIPFAFSFFASAEDAVDPAVLVPGQAHVVHIGIGIIGLGQED
ncbi:MAG: MptD family putative ECF transporter S component, partial [Bacteroidales bacterium]|nr:MptD family putative ECF transporter S component [Bacteroidales bacterium]